MTSDVEQVGKTVAFSNPLFQKEHPELVLQVTMVNHAKERKKEREAQKNQSIKMPSTAHPKLDPGKVLEIATAPSLFPARRLLL